MVVVVHQPMHADPQDICAGARKLAGYPRHERPCARVLRRGNRIECLGGGDFRRDRRSLRGPLVGGRRRGARPAGLECRQVALQGPAARPDRLLAGFAGKGQGAGSCQGAQHDRADHAAVFAGQVFHVQSHQAPGCGAGHLQDGFAVGQPVAERRFLADGEYPVGGRDQGGAVARYQSAPHGAPGFHQFRRDYQVHVARLRHQRKHRISSGRLRARPRKELQVVESGAGALGDSGNGSGLCDEAAGFSRVQQPLGQHAPALAAQGGDRQLENARLRLSFYHAIARLRWLRLCRNPIRTRRSPCMNRSIAPGLSTSSAW